MGKHSQPRNTNETSNDKTNPSFKWARMLHLLDYHHWHYVKKVLAHKKHTKADNPAAIDSNATDACESSSCPRKGLVETSQIEEQTAAESSHSTKSSPLPSSPRTKSSRAARIRKMIAKEVTKRRSRHRRSSTCPAVSHIESNDSVHHPLDENESHEVVSESVKKPDRIQRNNSCQETEKKCGLCNTMQIECQLGKRKEVGVEQDQINMLLQEIPDEAINQFPRSTSLQHSKEFLGAMDVLCMNKKFFLRILDDPGSSLRHHILAQQAAAASSNRKKALAKSGTFPINHPSTTEEESSSHTGLFKRRHKSSNSSKENGLNGQTRVDNRVPGRRFKDLRQKLKYVIKESRKERKRIAMDAVLHKVPYGKKMSEEEGTNKDSPRVSMCESELSSSSPCSNNNISNNNNTQSRRSPSLDESLDRYCQLYETTSSFSREANRMDTPERSRLRVMDDSESKKGLGRIFSAPDLQVFLSHRGEESCDGQVSSRIPNRRIMSYDERRKVGEGDLSVLNDGESTSKQQLDEHIGLRQSFSSEEGSVRIHSEIISNDDETEKSLASFEDNSSVTETHLTKDLITEIDDQESLAALEETKLGDHEPEQPQDHSSDEESPTFACTMVDFDQVQTPLMDSTPPALHHIRVSSKDIEEFNYVRDILQLSGYSGSQLLGTWYSSDQPVDPSVFVELESCSLLEPSCSSPPSSKEKGGAHSSSANHLLLFDLINEILLSIYERSVSYWPGPLTSCSRTHPMPKGYRVLDEVWTCINWYMGCSRSEIIDPLLDRITMRDLAKDDGWMNLQFDAECVGLEVEDLIFEDLLNELVSCFSGHF